MGAREDENEGIGQIGVWTTFRMGEGDEGGTEPLALGRSVGVVVGVRLGNGMLRSSGWRLCGMKS